MKLIRILFLFCCLPVYGQKIPVENTPHQVLIKWTPPKNQRYDGFHIYRADTCHGFVYLKNIGPVNSYIDKAVVGGERYRYIVRTVLKGVESVNSNIPEITVPLV